jgi:hypothetical protein
MFIVRGTDVSPEWSRIFIIRRQPDIARGIKYYLLSRGFGSNHVCPAKAALRDRPHLFRLCIDA